MSGQFKKGYDPRRNSFTSETASEAARKKKGKPRDPFASYYEFTTSDRKRGWNNAVEAIMARENVNRHVAALMLCRKIAKKCGRNPGHVNEWNYECDSGGDGYISNGKCRVEAHGNLPIPGQNLTR
jgi:hypothetical protein